MFHALARLSLRWPKTILLLTALFVGGALVYGHNVVDSLKTGGQTDPSSESAAGGELLDADFPGARPNLVLLVRPDDGNVDAPAAAAAAEQLTARLAGEEGVTGVTSYWRTQAPALRSADGTQALVVARIEGDETAAEERLEAIEPSLRQDGLTVTVGGSTAVRNQVTDTVREDIATAELIGIPLTALVLILVFRSFVAALLPLLVGVVAVIGTNATLKLIAQGTDVSVFAINLATGLSLGLAADYGLFIVRRYREERRKGKDTEAALLTTLDTAGRTVAFSSLTVAVAVLAMLVFPLYFLRSFAFAGVSVVLLAAATALLSLPAGLVVLGKHVDALDFTRALLWLARPFRREKPADAPSFWRRAAETVMRRPVMFALGSIAILLVLGAPFLRVNFGLPDDRLLPASFESHQVQQALRDDFEINPTTQTDILLQDVDPVADADRIDDYAAALSRVDGVTTVESVVGTFTDGNRAPPNALSGRFAAEDSTYLAVESAIEPVSSEGQRLVDRLRAVPAPGEASVAGPAADLRDAMHSLTNLLPVALGIIAFTTYVLIFLLTGSVLIPFKALAMNTISLSATFGALVWIFQDYHLASVFDFQDAGFLDVTLLVLLFCVAFGVSMDYEVFLLSRMKEEFVRTGDNQKAVVYGIEKTGGVVTAAALITSIVFIAMSTSQVTNIKMFGVGLALAMLLDASLVRTVLVPALMRLAGRANWWAPAPLRAVYDRFGLKEGSIEPEQEPASSRPRVPVAGA